MQGRAPLPVIAAACFQNLWVVALLSFGALAVIFAADYWVEFQNNREMFYWRVGSFFALSVSIGALVAIFTALRTHRWYIEDATLYLTKWGDLSGKYRNVTFRVQTQTNGDAELKVIFNQGEDTTLAMGAADGMLELCHHMKKAMKYRS